ncbi:MAG: Sortase family protein, LPXTG-site transpeptidase [Candidatus Roizmanbacteria bacterium GW2011_GWA2_36_23]|uniref:Sortase family protein, LPXTG-site transpeptidase n=1 Tax=Candidatus Roizmanbacteria bacterium GW2011_GWA2_36_23 TaxID=1618480 RepID=A0A0G0GQY4_9BACT|nr:MAG: Sortase family protein, LPXTG-site transpeptidase [Candidatus Roizmanbacteria bacterium GW2011_GWA2_36_23]
MALYSYLKKDNSPRKKAINYVSYISLTIGSILLFWSFYPILSFEIYSRLFLQQNVSTPIPRTDKASSLEQANSVLGSFITLSNNLKDFPQITQAKLWFPVKQQSANSLNNIQSYDLSIPKLNIKKAKVTVGGEDLSKSLVHYYPRSMPGEYGNVVIFGHSTLPQWYNVKDYKTIFTYLSKLDKGDKILINIGEIEYEYEIFELFVVNPEEVSVLDQKNDASYLTLITCVPPGTYLKRLVVRGKLMQLPTNFR